MAIVRAVKTGVWSDVTTWNTGALPTSADDVYSNTFTVTIDTSPTVLSISNASASGVTAGGGFVISANGITLTANVSNSSSGSCLTVSVGSSDSAAVVGAVLTPSFVTGSASCLVFSGAGTLNITGNISSAATGSSNHGVNITSTGTLNVTGSVSSTSTNASHGINNASRGIVNVTGSVTGGNSSVALGIANASTGTVSVIGNVTAGNAAGILQTTAGVISVTGTITGSNSAAGVSSSSASAQVTLSGPFITAANGTHPVHALTWRWSTTAPATYYQIRTASTGVIRSLYTADSVGGNPATSNVRSGTVYGPSNELTGTCAVPPAGSVALGVPVDNTTGTAAIDGASIRSAVGLASANLDAQFAAIPAAPSAAAIRTELDANSTKLANLDATVSSRSTYSGGDTSGTTTLLSRLTSTRAGYLDNLSAAPPSAADIAAAVWAAATRTLTTAIDNSATIAAAVWSYATGRTITGGTVDTLTNAPDVPTEAEIANAVREELAPELARVANAATTQEVGDIVQDALET